MHDITAAYEPYERHTFVYERAPRAFDHGPPISTVIRATRALAKPVPANRRALKIIPVGNLAAVCGVVIHGRRDMGRVHVRASAAN